MDKPFLEQPVLFLSDAHLGGFSPSENARIEEELIQVIDYCQQRNIRMAILGDLFDYWMEYPRHTPSLGKRLLDRFETFNRQLGPTLYITGNHDNWTRNHLRERGFYLEREHFTSTIGSKQLMMLHGDGLEESSYNLPRPPFHRLLRNDWFIKGYQWVLPARWGVQLMKYFSRLSRWRNSPEEETKILDQWSRQKLEKSAVDMIICGHDHVPRKNEFSFGTYVNLGTFYQHRTMALYNKDRLALVSWEHASQTLQTFTHTT